ncbi:hypothetical protein FQR65_LT18607 [Abscondita terminalis]|nr:hypothetical protein FQR65_LT18607 [Abscondita terminalis]
MEILPFHFEILSDSIQRTPNLYTRTIKFQIFEEGKFKIPPIEIKAGDKVLTTIPYEVEVINTAKKGEQINDIMNNKDVELGWQDYWSLYKFYIWIALWCHLRQITEAVKQEIATLNPNELSAGTAIGEGLAVAVNHLKDSKAKRKSCRNVVLISDGEDNEGHDKEAAALAKSQNIKITAVGIGTEQGAPVPDYMYGQLMGYKNTPYGEPVISKRETQALVQMSNGTGGTYIDGNNDNAAAQLRIKMLKKSTLFILFVFATGIFYAQDYNALVYKGNKNFENKKYDDASAKYLDAIKKNPQDFTAHYNLGNALYKQKMYREAHAEYKKG